MNSRKRIEFGRIWVALALLAALVISPLTFERALAIGSCDEEFYSMNDILFFNECAGSTEKCSTAATASVFNNKDYDGRDIFSPAQLEAIESNKSFYESAANTAKIPWQLLAAMHGRETGFKRYGPANGYGPYQITPSNYPVKAAYSDTEFQDATNKAAAFMKAKSDGRDLSDPNNVKYTFFAYNGTASVYKTQAKNLGFSDEEANNGEGSPYVMNLFDERRDPTVEPTRSNSTWGQIKADYGSIEYPANKDHGAFVYYSALTNGNVCGALDKAVNGNAAELQKAFTSYMNTNGERYAPVNYALSVNGCTTLSVWYIGEYTTIKYGRGNGEAVVRNLVAANKDKGLVASDKPVAPAIFSVAGGMGGTWGASGVPEGHVGIVVSVNESTQTATVLHTGSKKAGQPEKAWVAEFKYPASGVTFVNIGGYLK